MAQTVSNLTDVLKDAWTQDRLAKQFYDDNPVLDRMSSLEATTIGLQAQVPIHKNRNGGYTSTAAAGGNLNTAGNQQVDQALYTLVYHWLPIQLETAALAQAAGGDSAVVAAKDLEMQGAIADVKRQCTRQLVTNGDGKLAACATSGPSTTITLLADSATSYGAQAITRGWLHVGQVVDVGSAADTDSVATGVTITSVSSSTPSITTASSVSTTSGTDFVWIANPNSATAANTEMNGLRNIVNTSGALGGLNPSNAGEEFWASPTRDTSTTALSLNLLLNLSRAVRQNTGRKETYNVCGLKQEQAFYELLQNQVRFSGNTVDAGVSARWNGMEVVGLPDVLDTDWFCLTIEDFVKISPKGIPAKPTWATDLAGSGGSFVYAAGTTHFDNSVVLPLQIGVRRRNSHAAATGLTA